MSTLMPNQGAWDGSVAAGHERDGDFQRLVEPYRTEIRLYCYRMTGSLPDAEDLVQETFLRAWRAWGAFEGRSSPRTWLYRVATNVVLNFLASRGRKVRTLPDLLGPATNMVPEGEPMPRRAWIDPYPDSWLNGIADAGPGPEARYETHEAVQLAFVAAIQRLPPRQRAVLILRDVLAWSAPEVAVLLDGTVAGVNSALQRARETMEKSRGRSVSRTLSSDDLSALLDRYVRAFEDADVEALVATLREDATYSMPPWAQWFVGARAIGGFFRQKLAEYGGIRLVAIGANQQPAFAGYTPAPSGSLYVPHSLQVLTVGTDGIEAMTWFVPPLGPELFGAFGLPPQLGA